MPPLCTFCDIDMIDGQCPECFSIRLTELWRRQDMAEMRQRYAPPYTPINIDTDPETGNPRIAA